MRQVSRRFAALIPYDNQWLTEVDWSNDGGVTWRPVDIVTSSSSVTADSTSQIRWTCGLTLTGIKPGLTTINAYNTQLRVRHGLAGERLLPMGVYKVNGVTSSHEQRDVIKVKGSSFEWFVIASEFIATRTFKRQSAQKLATDLIKEVLPSAQIAWNVGDATVPRIVEPQDRWSLIDGDRDANSVARALGCRIYCTPEGNWVANPVPSLKDAPTWTAADGPGGSLVSAAEDLSDEGVFNVMVVQGQSTSADQDVFRAAVAQDLDPLSPTYVKRPIEQGGFGYKPKRYVSQLITSNKQAQTAAQAMLAPYLGQRQKVSFVQLHNPTIEPGDVGLVSTVGGVRRVILDSVTYSLDGSPLSAETRTTSTDLAGTVGEAPQDN